MFFFQLTQRERQAFLHVYFCESQWYNRINYRSLWNILSKSSCLYNDSSNQVPPLEKCRGNLAWLPDCLQVKIPTPNCNNREILTMFPVERVHRCLVSHIPASRPRQSAEQQDPATFMAIAWLRERSKGQARASPTLHGVRSFILFHHFWTIG